MSTHPDSTPPTAPAGKALPLPTAEPCTSCGTTGGHVASGSRRPKRARGLCAACYDVQYNLGTLPRRWVKSTAAPLIYCEHCDASAPRDTVYVANLCPTCYTAHPPAAPVLRSYPGEWALCESTTLRTINHNNAIYSTDAAEWMARHPELCTPEAQRAVFRGPIVERGESYWVAADEAQAA